MTAQQIGSLFIMGLGSLVFLSSYFLPRFALGSNGTLALIGSPLLRWFPRLIGMLLAVLGLVTYVH